MWEIRRADAPATATRGAQARLQPAVRTASDPVRL
jgi:hypothetical protein